MVPETGTLVAWEIDEATHKRYPSLRYPGPDVTKSE